MAATSFHFPVTASQVGTYFLGKYYRALQQQPDYLHHFFTASSTMLRIDGTIRQIAMSLPQIHALVMSLNYTGVEIKTAHSLESLNRGVLVMVSGSVRSKNLRGKRKFVETFFLAPQEQGYFVLNNIFHIIEDDSLNGHHSVPDLDHTDQNYLPKASVTVQKPASNHVDDDADDKYTFSEEQLRQIFEAKLILENNYAQSKDYLPNSTLSVPSQLSTTTEEFSSDHQKHTYASVVAKMQSTAHILKSQSQKSVTSATCTEKFGNNAAVKISNMEGEIKSVFVKNLPTTVTHFEIEEVFKKFGKIKPYEGVAIRTRENSDICYAFVEFEDVIGVQNAIKASKVRIASREVFIERRRPDGVRAYRGRGKGRGKGRHSTEASSRHFGGRGKRKGNSFYREVSH